MLPVRILLRHCEWAVHYSATHQTQRPTVLAILFMFFSKISWCNSASATNIIVTSLSCLRSEYLMSYMQLAGALGLPGTETMALSSVIAPPPPTHAPPIILPHETEPWFNVTVKAASTLPLNSLNVSIVAELLACTRRWKPWHR